MNKRDNFGKFICSGSLREKCCSICKKLYRCRSESSYKCSKYCSRSCQCVGQSISKAGKKPFKMTDDVKIKISKSKIGVSIWGKHRKTYWMEDEKNPNWKGDDVSYGSLHSWIRRKLKKPDMCTFCKTMGIRIEWASISHEAKRDLNDYIPLCKKCHEKYDTRKE